jgi:hypothetical protein
VRGEAGHNMAPLPPSPELPDFSLTLGGPLYRVLERSHLAKRVATLLGGQTAAVVFLCWVPLAALSLVQAHLPGGVTPSFLRDVETHVRFLVSLPVLVMGEFLVDQRIRPIMRRFLEQYVVAHDDLPKFYAAVNAAVRIHNSIIADIVLIIFVYTGGIWIWRHQIASDVSSWYASSQGDQVKLTMAGHWLAFVSVPVFQFVLLRWYMQFFVWFWLMLRVSRIKLRLAPLHPDREGGIGFVGGSSLAFAPLLFAQSALLSAQIATGILYKKASLLSSKTTIFGYALLSVAAALAPLILLAPQLIHSKRKELARYGKFASVFVTDFDQKWLESNLHGESSLAGEDIQALADLDNSFAVVRKMRFVPISTDDILLLFHVTLVPFLPLLLTIMPLDQLITRALKLTF